VQQQRGEGVAEQRMLVLHLRGPRGHQVPAVDAGQRRAALRAAVVADDRLHAAVALVEVAAYVPQVQVDRGPGDPGGPVPVGRGEGDVDLALGQWYGRPQEGFERLIE